MVVKEKEKKEYPSWESTTVVTLRVPKEVAEELEIEAGKNKKTRNKFAAELVEEALKDQKTTN